MLKAGTALVVASICVPSFLGCASSGRSKSADPEETVDMRVAEHDVHYLEIVTPDIEAAVTFYASAYGWKFLPAAPELGGARVAALPGGSLCGIRAPMSSQEEPIVRTYIRVADIGAAASRAAQLGATIALEPTELPGRGKIAIYFLGGIEQGIWQLP